MFIFLHDVCSTSSLWLPQIRGLFHLDQTYSDKYLLDVFTLDLPGHATEDITFDADDIEKSIQQFILEKKEKQKELAQKLIFSKYKEVVQALREDRLILIGHGVGAVFGLQFAMKNPSISQKLIMIGCGYSFNPVMNLMVKLSLKFIFSRKLETLQKLGRFVASKRMRTGLSLFVEHSQRRGIKSALEICYEYSFSKLYKKLSLNEQIQFSKIPILAVGGQVDMFSTVGSLKKLGKSLNNYEQLINTKKTVINLKNEEISSHFEYNVYAWSGHNPMDSHLPDFVYDVRSFLTQN